MGKAASAFPLVLGPLCHASNCVVLFSVAHAVLMLVNSLAALDFADQQILVCSLEQPSLLLPCPSYLPLPPPPQFHLYLFSFYYHKSEAELCALSFACGSALGGSRD